MRRLSRTVLTVILLLTGLASAQSAPGPTATLVTVGPGDEVWEKFGHNMIRIEDGRGFDVCFNWGLFDFDKPNFFANFIRGRGIYTMEPDRTAPLLELYQSQNRHVTFQKLRLSPADVLALYRMCDENYRLNPDYRYDYFKDNCSTRVRDMLDRATNGQYLSQGKGELTVGPLTYRHETLRLMRDGFWVSLGVDFLMGPEGDKPLDVWQSQFLPEHVAVGATKFAEPGVEPWPSTRPPPATTPPTRWPGLLVVGLAYAGVILAVRKRDDAGRARVESLVRQKPRLAGMTRKQIWQMAIGRMACVAPVTIWWLLSGFGGVLLLGMWLFTDHTATYANQNLWHFSPLAWLALVAAATRQRRLAAWVAMVIVGLSVVGVGFWVAGRFGGPIAQPNGGFILLSLPINLAVARGLWPALTKPRVADGMAA